MDHRVGARALARQENLLHGAAIEVASPSSGLAQNSCQDSDGLVDMASLDDEGRMKPQHPFGDAIGEKALPDGRMGDGIAIHSELETEDQALTPDALDKIESSSELEHFFCEVLAHAPRVSGEVLLEDGG